MLKVFWGNPLLTPRSAVSPKMSTPAQPMPTLFIAEFFCTLKMGMFTKKIELNTLSFDRDMRDFIFKKNVLKILDYSWEYLEQIPTVTVTYVKATYVMTTFVHIRNILAVKDPILTKLLGRKFFGGFIFVDQ